MKYIKTYQIFESEVVNNCEDILLELNDQGFITNVIHTPRYPGNPEIIVLKIRRKSAIIDNVPYENLFKYSEIYNIYHMSNNII